MDVSEVIIARLAMPRLRMMIWYPVVSYISNSYTRLLVNMSSTGRFRERRFRDPSHRNGA